MKTTVARGTLVALVVLALTGPVTCDAALARTRIAASRPQVAAALRQGPLMAWGYNGLGQLGIGTTQNQDLPVAVNAPRGLRATQARTGPFSVAVNSAGQVYAWGAGEQGELGNGAFKSHLRPVRVRLPKGVKVTSARGGLPVRGRPHDHGQGADLGQWHLRPARRRPQGEP